MSATEVGEGKHLVDEMTVDDGGVGNSEEVEVVVALGCSWNADEPSCEESEGCGIWSCGTVFLKI